MIVLDTHAWLWWTAEDSRLSRNAARAIEEADFIGISAISCWEVALLVGAKRLELDREPVIWMRRSLARERVILLELTPEVAVESVRLGWDHRDPGDRLIVATALVHDAPIVTKDRNIRAYRAARTIW